MLITTDNTAYLCPNGLGPLAPQVVYRGPVQAVAIAGDCWMIASDDGRASMGGAGRVREVDTGVPTRITSLAILSTGSLEVLIGTEPPHLWRWSADGPAERVACFDELACRAGWRTPWGGPPAVRSLATTPDGWVYVDIHVGSIMRSADMGVSWEPVTATLDDDVHQVATCPAAMDRVYANTARGVYVSDDRGRSWAHRAGDLSNRYGRAVAVCPTDPDVLLASVSDGPHGENVRGQLYRSTDAGRSWSHLSDGLPAATTANIDTFQVAFADAHTAYAAIGATIYRSDDRGRRWAAAWTGSQIVRTIACG